MSVSPGSGQVRLRQAAAGLNYIDVYHRTGVNQRFALKDAADAHKALEARATSGSTILTI
jgi:NADPH:quinone reductase-like Zn-dependent oxidoreductase